LAGRLPLIEPSPALRIPSFVDGVVLSVDGVPDSAPWLSSLNSPATAVFHLYRELDEPHPMLDEYVGALRAQGYDGQVTICHRAGEIREAARTIACVDQFP
jgi:hypothetical protein